MVTASELAAGAVTSAKLAGDSVTSASIAPGAVGMSDLAPAPAAAFSRSTAQSISTSGAPTDILFTAETSDVTSGFAFTTPDDQITLPATGVYLVTCYVVFASNASGTRYLTVELNGTQVLAQRIAATGTSDALTVSTPVFASGVSRDVSCAVFQGSPGALDVTTATMSVVRMGATG